MRKKPNDYGYWDMELRKAMQEVSAPPRTSASVEKAIAMVAGLMGALQLEFHTRLEDEEESEKLRLQAKQEAEAREVLKRLGIDVGKLAEGQRRNAIEALRAELKKDA